MGRTVRATLVAGLAVGLAILGIGVLLGFDAGPSAVTGAVFGGAMAGLIWLAARRAETFHEPDDPTTDGGSA